MLSYESSYRAGCLCSGSCLCSQELFPPRSYLKASDAREPEIQKRNVHIVKPVLFSRLSLTHHELLDQLLLVQLVLQNLDQGFDPGA